MPRCSPAPAASRVPARRSPPARPVPARSPAPGSGRDKDTCCWPPAQVLQLCGSPALAPAPARLPQAPVQAPLAQSAPKGQNHGVLTGCSRWARLHVPEQPGWLQHGELRADGGAHSSAGGQLGPHHRRANEGEGHERAPQAEPPPPETSSKCSPWATEPIL